MLSILVSEIWLKAVFHGSFVFINRTYHEPPCHLKGFGNKACAGDFPAVAIKETVLFSGWEYARTVGADKSHIRAPNIEMSFSHSKAYCNKILIGQLDTTRIVTSTERRMLYFIFAGL